LRNNVDIEFIVMMKMTALLAFTNASDNYALKETVKLRADNEKMIIAILQAYNILNAI